MENTLENKAKFFAQYWGQKIAFLHDYEMDCCWVDSSLFGSSSEIEVAYIELTPLSQISDEDAVKAFSFFGVARTPQGFITKGSPLSKKRHAIISCLNLPSNVVDYLRSKGYAVPWGGLSIEELVNRGWVKPKRDVSQVAVLLETLSIGDHYKYNPEDIGIFKVLSKTDPVWVDVVRVQSGRKTGSFPWVEVYPVKEVSNEK